MSPVISPVKKPGVIPRPTVFPGQPVRRVNPSVPQPQRRNPLQPAKPRVNPEPKNLRLRLKP